MISKTTILHKTFWYSFLFNLQHPYLILRISIFLLMLLIRSCMLVTFSHQKRNGKNTFSTLMIVVLNFQSDNFKILVISEFGSNVFTVFLIFDFAFQYALPFFVKARHDALSKRKSVNRPLLQCSGVEGKESPYIPMLILQSFSESLPWGCELHKHSLFVPWRIPFSSNPIIRWDRIAQRRLEFGNFFSPCSARL